MSREIQVGAIKSAVKRCDGCDETAGSDTRESAGCGDAV